jgi:hypothetical protein
MSARIEFVHEIGSIVYRVDVPVEVEGNVKLAFSLLDMAYHDMIVDESNIAEFEQGRRGYWTERGFQFKPLGDGKFELALTLEQWKAAHKW